METNLLAQEVERIRIALITPPANLDQQLEQARRPNPLTRPQLLAMLGGAPVSAESIKATWQIISAAPYQEFAHQAAWDYLAPALRQLISATEFDAFVTKHKIRRPLKEFVETV